ncbi:MAG: hypothetical protein HY842_12360 [Bacteroidetes bacterium]|nr:hypothetical protein [Bacteroidota bacterium]
MGKKPQTSSPALDSLLADTALMGNEAVVSDENPDPSASGPPAKISVKNDLDYSKEFLQRLTTCGLARNIELADSLLILEKTDTFAFPMDLPTGKWTNFVAMKGGYLYSLDVARVNYSTLEFNFELRKGKETVDQLVGKADLHPGFVLASEIDEDEETGTSYPASEYLLDSENCHFSIRLGDDEGVRKVKIIKQCKSGKFNIALEDCPALLEK